MRSPALVTMITGTVKQSLEFPRDFDPKNSQSLHACFAHPGQIRSALGDHPEDARPMKEDAALLPVEDARARTLALVSPLPPEWVRLEEALGRALAQDVRAQRTLPPWDN